MPPSAAAKARSHWFAASSGVGARGGSGRMAEYLPRRPPCGRNHLRACWSSCARCGGSATKNGCTLSAKNFFLSLRSTALRRLAPLAQAAR
eukprot:4384623-Lingulodinium_polyedra.AAC.1